MEPFFYKKGSLGFKLVFPSWWNLSLKKKIREWHQIPRFVFVMGLARKKTTEKVAPDPDGNGGRSYIYPVFKAVLADPSVAESYNCFDAYGKEGGGGQ